MISAVKLRDYKGVVTDTAGWDGLSLRPDDIIVDTPPKCGTTWMLFIVMMLIQGKPFPDAGSSQHAPWIDCSFRDHQTMRDFLDGLDRRRCIKSHTPMDGLPYAPELTYIVVYRHPIDVHFSMRSHAANMKHDMLGFMFPEDERAGVRRFIEGPLTESGTDDLTVASIVQHYTEARAREANGNVHFFHYADMTRDLRGQIGRLSGILQIDLPPDALDAIAEATTFASMRQAAETSERRFHKDVPFRDQAGFYASGTSNKWEGRLPESDLQDYADRIAQLIPPEEIAWLEWGERRAP